MATPEVVNPDNSGLFVGDVFLLVTAGWINAPHAVSVTITSDNLVIGERHGEQTHALADLEVIGDILQGQAIVRVPWTTDTNPTSATHLYEVCAHVIFADKQAGNESCGDFTL